MTCPKKCNYLNLHGRVTKEPYCRNYIRGSQFNGLESKIELERDEGLSTKSNSSHSNNFVRQTWHTPSRTKIFCQKNNLQLYFMVTYGVHKFAHEGYHFTSTY